MLLNCCCFCCRCSTHSKTKMEMRVLKEVCETEMNFDIHFLLVPESCCEAWLLLNDVFAIPHDHLMGGICIQTKTEKLTPC